MLVRYGILVSDMKLALDKEELGRRLSLLLLEERITEETAEAFRYSLQEEELPEDKKQLTLYYALSPLFEEWYKGEELDGQELAQMYDTAEVFVLLNRQRLRSLLLPFFKLEIASALSDGEPKKGDLSPCPLLWELVEEAGYRPQAATLNKSDRQAIDKAAEYLLSYIEFGLVNGEIDKALERKEEAPSVLEEDLIYENSYDEVVWTYPLFVMEARKFFFEVLHGDGLKEARNTLKQFYFSCKEYPLAANLRGTKFNKLVEEAERC